VTAARVFHLLAGPNGAGKSTLYRSLVRDGILGVDLTFVNADLYERDHLQHIIDLEQRSNAAREWADTQRAAKLSAGESFVSETVFSHESKLSLIEEAVACGFVVALYVVALDDPQRLLARVRQRVREGGHDVPADRILARYPRTLANLSKAVRLANVAYLYESREIEAGGPYMVAMCQDGQVTEFVETLPQWARLVLGEGQ
jgi:predicted ABC-type ATPase